MSHFFRLKLFKKRAMQHVIYYLEPLIIESLSKTTISAGYVRTRIEELRTNLQEVKTKFISDALTAKSKTNLKHYLNVHLKILISSANTLSQELSEAILKSFGALKISLLEGIQAHCEALIKFLLDTFNDLISEKIPYTDAISDDCKTQFKFSVSSITKKLASNELFLSICHVLLEILNNEDYKISPVIERRWSGFIKEMENIQDPDTISYEELTCILIRNGFNARDAHNILCRHLDRQLQLIIVPSIQRELLCSLEKIFTQSALSTPKRLFKELPKLGSLILKYIRAELRLIELLMDTNIGGMSNDPFFGSFTVSLSVKQLAFFVFLQVETGILLTRTAKQIHQYFATRFSILEGGAISEKSFKNAYYSHSPEDILKVIDKLSQMLVIAEESY